MTDGFFVESGSVDGEFMSIGQEEDLSLKKKQINMMLRKNLVENTLRSGEARDIL